MGGVENLIDRAGKRYVDKGLKYAAPTGPRIEQALLDESAENEATDAAKTIDCDFYCHDGTPSGSVLDC